MTKRHPRLGDFVFADRLGGGATHAGVLISRTETQATLEGRYDIFICEPQVVVVGDATIPGDLRDKVRAVRERLIAEGAMPAADGSDHVANGDHRVRPRRAADAG